MHFFDTTPMGRIVSRLSKDQDTIDQELSLTLYQLLSSFMNVLGTVGLVFYTFPFLGIIFAPLGACGCGTVYCAVLMVVQACCTMSRRRTTAGRPSRRSGSTRSCGLRCMHPTQVGRLPCRGEHRS
jgi:ABC-type multidrug transport system fused ATPase/permease subunit